jgi:hypothetical protein
VKKKKSGAGTRMKKKKEFHPHTQPFLNSDISHDKDRLCKKCIKKKKKPHFI